MQANIGKFITLKKKENDYENQNVLIKPFDDGLYFKFSKIIKPKHISFYCKTDNSEEAESCDLRMFQLNKDETLWENNEYGWEQK